MKCAAIRDGPYFAKACAQTAQLRRELAGAQDYERLSELRNSQIRSLFTSVDLATAARLPWWNFTFMWGILLLAGLGVGGLWALRSST
jgi:hypothetical protein